MYVLLYFRSLCDITIYGKDDSSYRASSWAQGMVTNKGLVKANSPLFDYKLKSLKAIKELLSELELMGYCVENNFTEVLGNYTTMTLIQSIKEYISLIIRGYLEIKIKHSVRNFHLKNI